ncbi:hypothetical protein M885DRAFT_517763 [Pelagophyceae sp. CCMP2097]|nr:hypothetical protein M885DRAFT_517763 [Pelagophyceae sp. CCMP2097]
MSFSVSSSSSESSQPRHTDPLARARRGVRLCAFAAAMLELPSRVSNGEAAEPHAESARRDPTLRGFCQRCRNSVVWLWSFVAPMVPSGLLEPRAEWAALWLPATKLAIGLVLASMWLVAPGLSDQNSRNGRSHWVGTTYIIVSTKDYGHSTTKCVNRVFGTAVAMGALGPIVQRSDNANWTDDHLTILLCVWVFVCAYAMTQLEVDLVYRATVASTTGALLFFDSDDSKNYVLYRTAFILYGVGLYLAVESTIFPTSSRNDVENFSREFVSAVDAALSDVLSALASEDAAAWQKYVESIAALRLRAAAAVADLPGARMEPHFGLRRPFLNATYTKLSLEQLRCVKGLTILSHALQRLDAATAQALLGSSQRRCVAGGSKAVVRRAAEAVAERTRDCSTRAAPLFALAAAASSTAEGEDESRQGVPLAEELFAALGPFRDFALAEDELCREWGTLLEAQLDKRSQRPVAPLVTLAAGLAVFALMDVCASLGRVGASLEQLAVASPTFLPTRQQPPKLEAQPKQEARPKDAEDPAAD